LCPGIVKEPDLGLDLGRLVSFLDIIAVHLANDLNDKFVRMPTDLLIKFTKLLLLMSLFPLSLLDSLGSIEAAEAEAGAAGGGEGGEEKGVRLHALVLLRLALSKHIISKHLQGLKMGSVNPPWCEWSLAWSISIYWPLRS
jgi:hypothetical protein